MPIMIFSAPINPNSENPVNNRNEPTGLSPQVKHFLKSIFNRVCSILFSAQPPLANAGFSVPPIPYPGGPGTLILIKQPSNRKD